MPDMRTYTPQTEIKSFHKKDTYKSEDYLSINSPSNMNYLKSLNPTINLSNFNHISTDSNINLGHQSKYANEKYKLTLNVTK